MLGKPRAFMVNRLAPIAARVVVALLLAAVGAHAADDFQYRPRVDFRWIDTTNWVANTWGELRFADDAGKFTNWRVSQQLQYTPWPEITAGVGYTFIQQDGFDPVKNSDTEVATHRAEFDLIPHLTLSDDVRCNCRTRFENRWIEGRGSWNPQFRIRPELTVALHRAGPLQEWFASNEFFYDLKADRYSQNRLIPTGITFGLGAHARLRLFYLIDSIHSNSSWVHQHAVQTQLLFSLR